MLRLPTVLPLAEAKKEEEKPQEPATAEIKPNKKILIEVKIEKKPLGVIVTGGKNNHVKVMHRSILSYSYLYMLSYFFTPDWLCHHTHLSRGRSGKG